MKITTGLVLVGLACLAAAFGAGFAIYLRPADASRNSAGTMASINGPYVSGTTISSSVVNARLADIETEITNSADRSGRGGFLAAVRGIDGTLAAPAFSWTSETGSGLFRNGAGDVRMSILGTASEQWSATAVLPLLPLRAAAGSVSAPSLSFAAETGTGWYRAAAGDIRFAVSGVDKHWLSATGLGIGGAPADPFDITVAGSASGTISTWLQASLADGNNNVLYMGKALSAGSAGILTYTKNATAANSTYCLGVFGGSASTLCVDGNAKTIIGSGGTGISASFEGSASCTPGLIASGGGVSCPITVTGAVAGSECAFAPGGVLGNVTSYCIVTANTCTITLGNPSTGNITPSSGTYRCRVFNN